MEKVEYIIKGPNTIILKLKDFYKKKNLFF